jgi:maleate cis-trans isomerase
MGKDVYIFTTSCGPLAGWVSNTIRGFATSHGLNVKSVQGFQISKKTEGGKRVPKAQADFDKDIQEFLIKTPIEQ